MVRWGMAMGIALLALTGLTLVLEPWESPAEGLLLGALFGAVVLGANALIGERWLDPEVLREVADSAGFGTPGAYLAIAAYIALVNSLLEEYVWRWFVYRKCEALWRPPVATVATACFFSVHHALAFNWRTARAFPRRLGGCRCTMNPTQRKRRFQLLGRRADTSTVAQVSRPISSRQRKVEGQCQE